MPNLVVMLMLGWYPSTLRAHTLLKTTYIGRMIDSHLMTLDITVQIDS